MLKDFARTTRGAYFRLQSDENIIKALDEDIQRIEKREIEQRVFDEFESYFQWFVFLALFFLIAEFTVSYRKSKYLKDKDLFA